MHIKPEERRLNEHLMSYWESLVKDGDLPGENDIDPKYIDYLWPHCFLIQIRDLHHTHQHGIFTYLGEAIIEAYENGEIEYGIDGLVSPDIDTLKDFFEIIEKTKTPMRLEKKVQLSGNCYLAFRQILLPLADKNGNIFSILGRAGWKRMDDGE